MKKILSILLLCASPHLMAQTTQPCVIQNIQTNPNSPQNIPPNFDGSTLRMLNWLEYQWDWQISGAAPSGASVIQNPFEASGNTNVQILVTSNTLARDNRPDNGWELIVYNDGSQTTSTPPFNWRQSDYDFPYLILYNRYRATLRVFVLYQKDYNNQSQDYDVATVRLKFLNNDDDFYSNYKPLPQEPESDFQSANLSAFGVRQEALDNFNKKVHAQTAMSVSINNYRWIWADFPMNYDPCVCQFEYQKFWISVDLVDRADVKLKGEIITSDLLKKSSGSVTNSIDIKKGIAGGTELGKALTKALKVHKDDKALIDNIKGLLRTTQSKGAGKKDTVAAKKDALGNVMTDNNGNPLWFNMAEIVTKNLPYAGMIFSLYDNLISDSKPQSPTSVSFKAQVDLEGTIKYKQENAVNTFVIVPGSQKPSNTLDVERPLYDEPLGVLTLMETPELEYVDYYTDYNSMGDFVGYHNGNRGVIANQWQPFIRQYKTKAVPKVAINPASGLELIDLRYTYRIKYKGFNSKQVWHNNMFNVLSCWGLYERFLLASNEYFNIENFYDYSGFDIIDIPVSGNSSPHFVSIKPFPVIDFFLDNNFQGYNIDIDNRMQAVGLGYENYVKTMPSKGYGILNTSYLPYSYIRDQTFYLYSGLCIVESEVCGNEVLQPYYNEVGPQMELKVQAIFKRQNDPNAESIIHTFTYPVSVVESDQNKDNNGNPQNSVTLSTNGNKKEFHLVSPNGWQQPVWADPLRLPFDLTLENTTVGPNDVQALNNIYIGDNVSIAPGTRFIAGNSIEVIGSEVVIPPTAVLEIRAPKGVTPLQPQDYLITDVSSYCVDKNRYNPEVVNKRNLEAVQPRKVPNSLGINIHPNPAQDIVHISGVVTDDIERVICLDALGRRVQQWEGYRESLDVSMLQVGVYLIQVEMTDGRTTEVKKLTIANY